MAVVREPPLQAGQPGPQQFLLLGTRSQHLPAFGCNDFRGLDCAREFRTDRLSGFPDHLAWIIVVFAKAFRRAKMQAWDTVCKRLRWAQMKTKEKEKGNNRGETVSKLTLL
jgi:hypothetical protein